MIQYTKDFLEFWSLYPRRIAKLNAFKAYLKSLKLGASHAEIIFGVRQYVVVCVGKEERFIKHPATWLNGGCWDDEHSQPGNNGFPAVHGANGAGGETSLRREPAGIVAAALRVAARYEAKG
jgi:hypothetical protein